MAADAAKSERRRDGMPRGTPFAPGQSGNPGAKSAYQRQLEAAIQAQETPERVCEVIAAMHDMATSGNPKGAPAAAKVYLGAVGVSLDKDPVKLDLTDAPEVVVDYLAEKLH